MRLTIFTEPQQGADYDTLLHVARRAEECGFDGFFRSDHFLKMGGVDGLPGPTDAWVTLAGLARDTSRLRLGTLMSSATFRLPGPLAIAVATVDHMSGGRVELGIGAGWYEEEHRAYGIPFPDVQERFDRLEEQLEIITGLWSTPLGATFTFEGRYYQLVESPALPKPVSEKLRVLVGGVGRRRTPRLGARFADEFNVPFCTPQISGKVIANVRNACRELSRVEEPEYSVAQVVCCGRDEAEVARRAANIGREVPELRENGLAGTPAELGDKIGAFRELGCSRIHLQLLDLDDLDHIDLLASEVMAQL